MEKGYIVRFFVCSNERDRTRSLCLYESKGPLLGGKERHFSFWLIELYRAQVRLCNLFQSCMNRAGVEVRFSQEKGNFGILPVSV